METVISFDLKLGDQAAESTETNLGMALNIFLRSLSKFKLEEHVFS